MEITEEKRKRLLKILLLKRKNELNSSNNYNQLFVKSPLFKWSLVVRALFLLIITVHFIFDDKWSNITQEVVVDADVTTIETSSRRKGKYITQSFTLITNVDTYYSESKKFNSSLKKGDTILLERSILNVPIYYTKKEWDKKYGLNISVFFYILFIITVFSMFFTSGSDKKIKFFIFFIALLNLFGILFFFI